MMESITLEVLKCMAAECREELRSLGLEAPPVSRVSINVRAKTLFGRCTKDAAGMFHIEIMSYLNRLRSVQEIRQTVMHEVIHTLPGCGNHGQGFQQVARRVNETFGYAIATTSKLSSEARAAVDFKYVLKCGHCGQELKRYHRKPRLSANHYHRACGAAAKGKLQLFRYE